MVTVNTPGRTIGATSPVDEAQAPAAEIDDGRTSCNPGQQVRWKRGARWHFGHLGDPPFERDGSLRVFEKRNGAARALRPTTVQLLVRGPRGGLRWVPFEPAGTASRPAESFNVAAPAAIRPGPTPREPPAPEPRRERPGPELGL
jgi:hypothetical protein